VNAKEKEYLLELARQTLEKFFEGEKDLVPKDIPHDGLKKKAGTFVTLTKDGNLRGCIGSIMPVDPIYSSVVKNSLSAAFMDSRFAPLAEDELNDIKIEISVLTVPKELKYDSPDDLLKKLRPGVDGVILDCGGAGSTFLPQVWKSLPEKEKFLSHLCIKAWLEPECWKNEKCKISVYQVEAFEEE
jgi:AmmeMemoRadiSam system protein A